MFKRLLGIKKLEKNFKILGDSLNRSWQWIDSFNKNNSKYEERISRLEKSNTQLIEVTKELINQLQSIDTQEPKELEEPIEEPAPVNVVPSSDKINLPDKDMYLVKLIHQYAAFDKESSIETNALFDNLTFKITRRGLRKKLGYLVDKELLRTFKKGNTRYWYLNSGALGKIKKALQSE